MIERADDGVIESGTAAGVDAFQGFLEFRNAVGEILVQIEIKIVVEIDDKGFVLRIAGLNQGERGFVHTRTHFNHTAAVVDDQAHGDGNVFALEQREVLLGFILGDAEIIFAEVIHEFAVVVDYGSMQDDQVDFHLDAAGSLIGIWLIRRRWRRGLYRDLREGRSNTEQECNCKKRSAKVNERARSSRFLSRQKAAEDLSECAV